MITPHRICVSASGQMSEDAYGWVGHGTFGAAWVMDGATGLGDREYTGTYSDAAWYAQQFSHALSKFSLEQVPAEKIFLSAIRQVAELWYAAVGDTDVPRYALPSAAGVWIRWQSDTVEAVSLGDCRGWHYADNGALIQLGALDEEPNDDPRGIIAQQAMGVAAKDMRAVMLNGIRAGRSLMNEPHGYPIFSIHEETVRHLDARAWQVTPGDIILCSDGLFRWVDVLRQGNTESFLKSCSENSHSVLARVRELENADADCMRFPRLKRHDDATGIVLRCRMA